MTMTNNLKLSADQLIQAIREGEMPDGSAVQTDADLDALAEALDALDPEELDALMEATGGGSAAAEATANRLSQRVAQSEVEYDCNERDQTPVCVIKQELTDHRMIINDGQHRYA